MWLSYVCPAYEGVNGFSVMLLSFSRIGFELLWIDPSRDNLDLPDAILRHLDHRFLTT